MNYPLRPQNHVIENISKLAFRQAMPQEWVLNEYFIDYGTDFQCEIVKDNAVLGIKFSIQLKAKSKEFDVESVIIKNIKRSTINRWIKSLEPIMIVAYVDEEKNIYWQWVTENTFDLTSNQKSYQIKISKKQILNETVWDDITRQVEKIYERKYLVKGW
ncbi:MAG: DUF4365 domain-containing protein [Bacteroidetes bacterium]|nr:DUF4365 domain-containing protein [Bacteroidota bacterium]